MTVGQHTRSVPGVYGGLTIGGWRDQFRQRSETGTWSLAPMDCGYVADLLEAMRSERIADAQAIMEAQAEAASLRSQRDELADLVTRLLPYVEDVANDPAYKPGHIGSLLREMRAKVTP